MGGIILLSEVITARKQADEKIRQQLEELQRWYRALIGREGRVTILKREVNDLLRQAGKPIRYLSQASD